MTSKLTIFYTRGIYLVRSPKQFLIADMWKQYSLLKLALFKYYLSVRRKMSCYLNKQVKRLGQ